MSNLKSLITLQKKFVRLICNVNFYSHSLPLFVSHNILPFRYLYIFKVLTIFFKLSGNAGPTVDNIHNYSTRQTAHNILRLPKPNCTLFKKCFIYLSIKIFNVIPVSVKQSRSFSVFKKTLKKWLLTKSYDEIEQLYS